MDKLVKTEKSKCFIFLSFICIIFPTYRDNGAYF